MEIVSLCLGAVVVLMLFIGAVVYRYVSKIGRKKDQRIRDTVRCKIKLTSQVFRLIIRVIRYSDPIDLWVMNIKSLWSFAHVIRRDHVNGARTAEHVKGLFVLKSKYFMIIKHGRHICLRNSRGAQRYVGFFFFLIVLSGWWLAGQLNSDHVITTFDIFWGEQLKDGWIDVWSIK